MNSAAGTPTGTVTFLDGNIVLGMVPINAAGQATLMVSLGVGNHALTAVFGGNDGFAASTSAVDGRNRQPGRHDNCPEPVDQPHVVGQTVSFTATVTAVAPGTGTPTGTVTLLDGNMVLGTAAVDADGRATFRNQLRGRGRPRDHRHLQR